MPDANEKVENDVVAVDQSVGDDGDEAGLGQPVTQDEIEDVLNAPEMPIEERAARLRELAARLDMRENVDRGGEMDPLLEQVNEALNLLAEGGHAYSSMDMAGLDPQERSDAQPPDETGPER